MEENRNFVDVGGEIRNIVGDGTVAAAAAIKDYNKDNKFQSQINFETDEHLAQIDTDLDSTSSGIKDRLTTLENLRTLCDRCNMGKSDKM